MLLNLIAQTHKTSSIYKAPLKAKVAVFSHVYMKMVIYTYMLLCRRKHIYIYI